MVEGDQEGIILIPLLFLLCVFVCLFLWSGICGVICTCMYWWYVFLRGFPPPPPFFLYKKNFFSKFNDAGSS